MKKLIYISVSIVLVIIGYNLNHSGQSTQLTEPLNKKIQVLDELDKKQPIEEKIKEPEFVPIKKPEPVKEPIKEPISSNCNTNYSGCLDKSGDYDCAKGSGNGPNYTGMVKVLGYDQYDLDRDNDGWGCE